MRGLYRLAPIERLAKQGNTVRRAMLVDGYGNDVLAISFIQSADSNAIVELRVPCARSSRCFDPLLAPIDAASWNNVARLPDGLRNGTPRKTGANDSICLHSWVVVIEAADPSASGGAQRATENSCADGPAVNYAFAMADLALANLPDCALLDAATFRNTATLLETCARLVGNRRTASEAYRLGEDLRRSNRNDTIRLEDLFVSAAQDKVYALRDALKGTSPFFKRIEGIDRDHARISGSLYRTFEDDGPYWKAVIELELVRENGRMKIANYRLGPFKKD